MTPSLCQQAFCLLCLAPLFASHARGQTPKEIDTSKLPSGLVHGVVFSPDGKLLAATGLDGLTRIWNVETGKEASAVAGGRPIFTPDSKTVVTLGKDKAIHLWEVATAKEIGTVGVGKDRAEAILVSPDGETLALLTINGITLADIKTAKERASWKPHTPFSSAMAFSPDSKLLASAGHDKLVKLWDVQTAMEKGTLTGHEALVRHVAFSPDGGTLASASLDGSVKIWNLKTLKLIGTLRLEGKAVSDLIYSKDGQWLAACEFGGTIRIWNAKARTIRATLKDQTISLAFSPDGTFLAYGARDYSVKLYDIFKAKTVALAGHTNLINGVAFSPDGTLLASSGFAVKVWNVPVKGKK